MLSSDLVREEDVFTRWRLAAKEHNVPEDLAVKIARDIIDYVVISHTKIIES
ncbi:MAG: hypothetical protein RBR86_02420 [Pseudobdellovibrionaceae bacterium]|nr:hypothetical protein [Pseudobdellovibrionaceae bacterium]